MIPTMRPAQPSGTVTLVFTDIEGSTRLLHELGTAAYKEALSEHRRIVREACARYSGYEVDYEGDAFFYAFSSAHEAVSAVSEAMEGLQHGPIAIRVGIHTGSPELDPPKYVGIDVHTAARIMSAGHGGQVVVSPSTAALLETPLLSLGSHRLKDLDEPISLQQLGEGSFPPLKTIANTNLPTPVSSFLGREEELYEADVLLQGTRLLTVTGPGGAGKTRFALELARRAREERFSDYPAGVFACFLSPLRDPSLVLPTIAQTLSVAEQQGQPAIEALAAHLEGKRMLLLLDNLEHLLDAADELAQLLERCAGLSLLATTRETLRLRGEIAYPLPPLAEDEGVALVCERARVGPSEAIRELARRLEGLPLALELAAARLNVLTPEQLLDRLSQRLDLLKGARDADPRQQTLRATIEWSYDLLTDEEQQLFGRLAVFAGGCTLEAAEVVCGADLDTLQSLVDKSLLRFTDGRFWMLETIREYATEQLRAASAEDDARARHVKYFADSLRSVVEDAARRPRPDLGHKLEPERANLRAGLVTALQAEMGENAYVLVLAYAYLCRLRGPLMEARSLLTTVLEMTVSVEDALRVWTLRAAASLSELQRDHVNSIAFAERALTLARSVGDPEMIASALLALGVAEGTAMNFERAEELEREALTMFGEAGNDRQVRQTLGLMAWIAIARRDYVHAQELCERALRLSREAGDDRGVVLALGNLGHALGRQGQLDQALLLEREALHITRDQVDLSGVADGLLELASLAIARCCMEEAAVMLGSSAAFREVSESALDVVAQEMYDDVLTALRAGLPKDVLAAAMNRGRAMALDEAVEYALANPE
jgi:predicted ATPase/class 3 adenylate cyclase